jgi:phosphate transport system substrate-binding protein
MNFRRLSLFLFVAVMMSCAGKSGGGSVGQSRVVSGAGATFPYPYYNIVFRDFMRKNAGYRVNYGAIGSGGGIRSLRDFSVDFGASDAFLTDAELASMGGDVIHIATCMGGVVMAYRLEGVDSLKLTGELLADIYMGKIRKWNDRRIGAINDGVSLPDLEITPVYRSDGSGTTFNFSEYLSMMSVEWNRTMGKGKSLKWLAGIAAKGNPGVAGIVEQTEGSIGYIGSEYALTLQLPTAKIRNKSGRFVEATLESISAAGEVSLPDDMRATLTNSNLPEAYPISLMTWLLVYKEQCYNGRTREEAEELVELLEYVISSEGQKVAAQINYAPLSGEAIAKNRALIETMTYEGERLR